uniref:FLYWCH-type domain-containing protein n=1 Tax=Anopheles atroparvus TaxID=41427 RepID=A0A182J4A7_ANOAO
MVVFSGSGKVQYAHGRGNNMLIYDGHRYIKNNVYGDRTYWKCTKWHAQCKARAITNSVAPDECTNERSLWFPYCVTSVTARDMQYSYKQSQRSGRRLLVVEGVTFFRNRHRLDIYYTKSFRGRPAIIINGMKYLLMSENTKRIVWRCSMMATEKLKCPARIVEYKNPTRFVCLQEKQHVHAPSKRNKTNLSYQGCFQVQYRTSQKGKLQLTCNGFYYCREKSIHDKHYWRCIYYTTKIKCHARLHTLGDQVIHMGTHNHIAKLFKRSDYKRLSEIILDPLDPLKTETESQSGGPPSGSKSSGTPSGSRPKSEMNTVVKSKTISVPKLDMNSFVKTDTKSTVKSETKLVVKSTGSLRSKSRLRSLLVDDLRK